MNAPSAGTPSPPMCRELSTINPGPNVSPVQTFVRSPAQGRTSSFAASSRPASSSSSKAPTHPKNKNHQSRHGGRSRYSSRMSSEDTLRREMELEDSMDG